MDASEEVRAAIASNGRRDVSSHDGQAMNEQKPASGNTLIGCGSLFVLLAALEMSAAVYNRHYQDGVAWSDVSRLLEVEWHALKAWRPLWWQGWLWWGAFTLGGLRLLQLGLIIRRSERPFRPFDRAA